MDGLYGIERLCVEDFLITCNKICTVRFDCGAQKQFVFEIIERAAQRIVNILFGCPGAVSNMFRNFGSISLSGSIWGISYLRSFSRTDSTYALKGRPSLLAFLLSELIISSGSLIHVCLYTLVPITLKKSVVIFPNNDNTIKYERSGYPQ